ncbi:hypothetical protein BDZ89DRAFT_1048837 [Hymenopellis radicata]|nr:hypothetical protein BDZ89DRAFT_1048837 [Hymenopellis radicata]
MSHFTVLQPCCIFLVTLPFDATSAEAIEAFTKGVEKDAKTALLCPVRPGYDFGTQLFVFISITLARPLPLFAQAGVSMPNSEKAYLLVLEYIAGFTLYELATAFFEDNPEHDGGSDAWEHHLLLYKKLVPLNFAALQTFHDCGVAHDKMHPSNIIIVPKSYRLFRTWNWPIHTLAIEGNFSAVVVSFRSHSLQRGQPWNDERKEMDRDGISANLGGCCDSHGAIVEAAKKGSRLDFQHLINME